MKIISTSELIGEKIKNILVRNNRVKLKFFDKDEAFIIEPSNSGLQFDRLWGANLRELKRAEVVDAYIQITKDENFIFHLETNVKKISFRWMNEQEPVKLNLYKTEKTDAKDYDLKDMLDDLDIRPLGD